MGGMSVCQYVEFCNGNQINDIVEPNKVVKFLEEKYFTRDKETSIKSNIGYEGIVGRTEHDPLYHPSLAKAEAKEVAARFVEATKRSLDGTNSIKYAVPIGKRTIDSVISALSYEWKLQKLDGRNHFDKPRGEFPRWNGRMTHIRDRVAINLRHQMLLGDENLRHLDLSDCISECVATPLYGTTKTIYSLGFCLSRDKTMANSQKDQRNMDERFAQLHEKMQHNYEKWLEDSRLQSQIAVKAMLASMSSYFSRSPTSPSVQSIGRGGDDTFLSTPSQSNHVSHDMQTIDREGLTSASSPSQTQPSHGDHHGTPESPRGSFEVGAIATISQRQPSMSLQPSFPASPRASQEMVTQKHMAFRFRRDADTVQEIWEEYQRYIAYKNQTRRLGYDSAQMNEYLSEKRFINNRLVIVKEIEHLNAIREITVDQAISQLDHERCTSKKSIAQFQDLSRKRQKGRKTEGNNTIQEATNTSNNTE
ncbi:hypothetical protein BGZ80_004024 [Entomortierella chlamydospora]|uniref:Transcription activator GCR1-like domain-containing protein n=1 Tax=Entomortierella chlamydospora TaxID=101097 RepID=A0A9P6T368_9FUNG|nr:hypothetical protein BGZ80_004024 [Entomortierella chlamydospora]